MSHAKCSVEFAISSIVLVDNVYQVTVTRADGVVMPLAHFQKSRIEERMTTRNQTVEQAIYHGVCVYFQHIN